MTDVEQAIEALLSEDRVFEPPEGFVSRALVSDRGTATSRRGWRQGRLQLGRTPGERRTITYAELLDEVCRFANALKSLGVRKGDRVNICLGMIPELPVAMLACARIGAPHCVVFRGFSGRGVEGPDQRRRGQGPHHHR